jgi:hypothetical protein
VEVAEGKLGELTVLVDGQVVARKWLFFKPSVQKALRAVRETGQSTTQAKG